MRFLILFFLLFSLNITAQQDILAREYFKNGQFEKALVSYKKLVKKYKNNLNYVYQLVKTHQQLEQYAEAKTLLEDQLAMRPYGPLLIELGYNYKLQNDSIQAELYFEKAKLKITENPSSAGTLGQRFEMLSLLDHAIETYEKAMLLRPDLNYNMLLARIYGERGDVARMFQSYVDFSETNTSYLNSIKRELSTFISENGKNENNVILKKILLKKIQSSPNTLWNEMLSWLFVQQKDYKKAFLQEKAIYKRELATLERVYELAGIAAQEKHYDIAVDILHFIIENTQDIDTKIEAELQLITIETQLATKNDYKVINKKYLSLLESFGRFDNTIDLQIAYAHFLAFHMQDTDAATALLKEALDLKISEYRRAKIKLELGDILVLQEKFNEALIYYTQIQRNLKNSKISQEARFKVAKTSYYKGDFIWAESQLKILKSSTSQLTANDALDLKLLISDNKLDDSLQVALSSYAKADLLAFQNKKEDAIHILNGILEQHKTESIIPQALLKQAQLFEATRQFEKARDNYERLIKDYKDSILMDDALFALAQIYAGPLAEPEKAKLLFEKIIFNHSDSIYFIQSRKNFRALRGDAIH